MLKIILEEGNCQVVHQGDPVMVAAELGAAISGIYQAFANEGIFTGVIFKGAMQQAVADDSPVWVPDHNMTAIKKSLRQEEKSMAANKKSGAPNRPKFGHRSIHESSRLGLCGYYITQLHFRQEES